MRLAAHSFEKVIVVIGRNCYILLQLLLFATEQSWLKYVKLPEESRLAGTPT